MNLLSLVEINYRLNIHTAFEDKLYRAYHIDERLLKALDVSLRAQIVFMENYIKWDMYDHPTIQSIINQTKEIGEDSFKYLIKELENKRNIVKEEFIRIIATILLKRQLNRISNKLKNDK
jgi:hypothetical protein